MSAVKITQNEGGVTVTFKIVPGSSKTAVCGSYGEMVKVKVAAAPEKGKANKCLINFLSKKLRINKNDVTIISGETGPIKQVKFSNLSVEKIRSELLGK